MLAMSDTLPVEQLQFLYKHAYDSIFELADEQGLAASSRKEVYGCLFGRDSAISVLKLLSVLRKKPDMRIQEVCRRTLLSHTLLQGKSYQIESGEEPGKFIHEFRQQNYERLVNRPRPWYIYPDKVLRNYDSVDSTPLMLIAFFQYWTQTQDAEFLLRVLPSVEAGLRWIMTDGDKDGDFLIEYELSAKRQHGGLIVQSWTDSQPCLASQDGSFPDYPIAAVEVQAMAWSALKNWASFFANKPGRKVFARRLDRFAAQMQRRFKQTFFMRDADGQVVYAYQALDGKKRPIGTFTGNPLLCLWATVQDTNGQQHAMIEPEIMHQWVERAFEADLFDPQAGIRTMSMLSPTFDPSVHSYHNGSFWPFLNGLIHEGLERWGFYAQASALRTASLLPLLHFRTSIELYCSVQAGVYKEYISATGQKGCRQQAWTAAAILDWLS
jgi:glycogen debranching enzyme